MALPTGNLRRIIQLLPIILALVISVTAYSSSNDDDPTASTDTEEIDGTITLSDSCFDSTDQTVIMTCLSQNLLSTLDTDEIESTSYDLTQENTTVYWSNLPFEGPSTRNGIALEDMDSDAKEAAGILIDAALSTQ